MTQVNPAKQWALVTGALGAMGTEITSTLVAHGWQVIATDHPSVVESASTDWMNAMDSDAVSLIPFDLAEAATSASSLAQLVQQISSITGDTKPLSALIHNAAIQRLAPFCELTAQDWLQTMIVNMIAPALISREFLAELIYQRGSIIHISSIHAQLTKPGFAAYAASKAALTGLTRAMAVELGAQIRVNAIEPAAIATPMLDAGFADAPHRKTDLEACHPTVSIGTPADVARAVLFLLDPANTFLNGCVLPLGGGIHSRLHDPA